MVGFKTPICGGVENLKCSKFHRRLGMIYISLMHAKKA